MLHILDSISFLKISFFSWKGVFTNLRVDNLDTFINNKLTFSMITMKSKFNFTFPDIIAQGFQDIRGHVFTVLPHWAYGDFYVAPVSKFKSHISNKNLSLILFFFKKKRREILW